MLFILISFVSKSWSPCPYYCFWYPCWTFAWSLESCYFLCLHSLYQNHYYIYHIIVLLWSESEIIFYITVFYIILQKKTKGYQTCRIAVRNPWGLKKPVIQKTIGRPFCTQRRNCASLSNSSVYQKPRVADSQDTLKNHIETVL